MDEKVKIIFLDIDGVLNSLESTKDLYENKDHGSYFCDAPHEMHIKWLNKIVKSTGARIVISSTWRKMHSKYSMDYILFLSGYKGEHVLGSTPVLWKRRGLEIQQWIDDFNADEDRHSIAKGKQVGSFIILDDDGDMEHLMGRLVKTDGQKGLTEKEADLAIKLLNE